MKENAETEYINGNFEGALSILTSEIDSEKKKTFKNYNLRAQLYYDKMDYEKC